MKMGQQIGTITRGKLADIIVIDGNPLLSMRDLRNVVAVIKDGRIYKGVATKAPTTSSELASTRSPQ